MYSYEVEHQCRVKAAEIWRLLGDVRRWPEWDHTLREVTADGPTVVGLRPLFRIYSRKPRRARILEIGETANSRRIRVALPFVRPAPGVYLSWLTTTHEVFSTGLESRIASEITLGGPFPDGVRRWLARDFEAGLPVRVEQLMVVAHAHQVGRPYDREKIRSNEELRAADCRRIRNGRVIVLGDPGP